MTLSLNERDRRYHAIRAMMEKRGLSLLIVASNAMSPGHIRYFANFPTQARHTFMLFPKEEDPTLFVPTRIQEQVASDPQAWVKDSRFASNFPEALGKRIRELDPKNKNMGLVGVENMTPKMYEHLLKEVLSSTFFEVTKEIYQIRMIKSNEEQALARHCAQITDQLFSRIKEVAKAGMSEFDVYAEIEYFLRKQKAEGGFNLIASGLFPFAPFITPSERVLRPEDSLLLELTPRYRGYYTQLAAVHPLQGPSPKMRELLDITFTAQKAGLNVLKPGYRAGDVARAMKEVVEKAGYTMPYRGGHSLGHEHTEPPEVVETDETPLKPGMTLVIHPSARAKTGEGVFFGDTYLVTESGWERLNSTFSADTTNRD